MNAPGFHTSEILTLFKNLLNSSFVLNNSDKYVEECDIPENIYLKYIRRSQIRNSWINN